MTRVRRWAAGVAHDWLAHGLLGLSGGAPWAQRFHDWIGVRWAVDDPRRVLVIRGHGELIGEWLDTAARSAGWEVVSRMHDVAVIRKAPPAPVVPDEVERA